VVKCDCKVQEDATISRLKVPLWDLTIDNGSGQEAEVSANIKLEAAAFTQTELDISANSSLYRNLGKNGHIWGNSTLASSHRFLSTGI
jgi:hypothetical protein